MLLMSRMAVVFSRNKVMEQEMEKLFFAYYNVVSREKLGKEAIAVLDAIRKGGRLFISLPPIAPFIKPYFNALITTEELVAQSA